MDFDDDKPTVRERSRRFLPRLPKRAPAETDDQRAARELLEFLNRRTTPDNWDGGRRIGLDNYQRGPSRDDLIGG